MTAPGLATRSPAAETHSYLAVHTIAESDVVGSEAYLRNGGGSFARWQEWITDWRRNIYDGMDLAPDVGSEDVLVLSDGPLASGGQAVWHLVAVGLDGSPQRRWVSLASLKDIGPVPAGAGVYEPLTPQLRSRRSSD